MIRISAEAVSTRMLVAGEAVVLPFWVIGAVRAMGGAPFDRCFRG
jgi:hypothetical protein